MNGETLGSFTRRVKSFFKQTRYCLPGGIQYLAPESLPQHHSYILAGATRRRVDLKRLRNDRLRDHHDVFLVTPRVVEREIAQAIAEWIAGR